MCSRWRPSLEGPRVSGFRFNRRDGKGAQHRTRKSRESAPRQGTRDGSKRASRRTRDRALDGRAHARVFLHEARVVVLGVERPRRPVEREARARGVELLRRDGAARRRVPERRNAPRGAGSVRGAQADERRRARTAAKIDSSCARGRCCDACAYSGRQTRSSATVRGCTASWTVLPRGSRRALTRGPREASFGRPRCGIRIACATTSADLSVWAGE